MTASVVENYKYMETWNLSIVDQKSELENNKVVGFLKAFIDFDCARFSTMILHLVEEEENQYSSDSFVVNVYTVPARKVITPPTITADSRTSIAKAEKRKSCQRDQEAINGSVFAPTVTVVAAGSRRRES